MIKTILTAAATVIILACHTSAATVASFDATWNKTKGGKRINGEGTSSLSWGQAATDRGQSGYTFKQKKKKLRFGKRVTIGKITHSNNVLYSNTGIRSTRLKLNIRGRIKGQEFRLKGRYKLKHIETKNNSRPCEDGGRRPCHDRVDISVLKSITDTIRIKGKTYEVMLEGLEDGILFQTSEKKKRHAKIFARIVETATVASETAERTPNPSAEGILPPWGETPEWTPGGDPLPPSGDDPLPAPVPLPAGVWLMLTGAGALGAMRFARARQRT